MAVRTRVETAVRAGDGVLLCTLALAAVLLRLPFLHTPLGIDEGGYAYVASAWNSGEGGIYGAQWVDRPPLLIALYAVAVAIAGDVGVRLLGCVASALLVVACAQAARRLAGPSAMVWAGMAAVALSSSTILQAHTVNAELLASALVAVCIWLVVEAMATSTRARIALTSTGAGLAAAGAVLVKQSFVDALVFAGVACIIGACVGDAAARRRVALIAGGGALGIVVALSLVAAWAHTSGPGVGELLEALYGFRLDARVAIDASNAPGERAARLALLAIATGLLTMFAFAWIGLVRIAMGAQLVRQGVEPWVVRATAAGLCATGVWGVYAITQGGNWWRHYLLQLLPVVAIGLGIVLGGIVERSRSRVARGAVRSWWVASTATAVAWACATIWAMSGEMQRTPAAAGDWLRAAARPGDTLVVTWGHPNVLRRSGMQTPYEMSWSLPIRVRDPELTQLRGIVAGQEPPTWILEWRSFDLWDLDESGRLQHLIDLRYDRVATVCGRDVYRLRTAGSSTAALPVEPTSGSCSSGIVGSSIEDLRW